MGLSPSPFAGPAFVHYREPQQYQQFRCSAAACEDTCCEGWSIAVDRRTYEKYQECSHPVLAPQLQQLININPSGHDNHFATITLNGSGCPFLSDRLCSIQRDLGEDHLGRVCATYPRITNQLGATTERCLDLSCPEAARLILRNPNPSVFLEVPGEAAATFSVPEKANNSHPYFPEIRSSALSILQNRNYPVSQRLILLGHLCDKLHEMQQKGTTDTIPQSLTTFAAGVQAGFYDNHLKRYSANAATQLNFVLGLIISRVQLDFTQPRFMDMYQEFMDGLEMQSGSGIEEIGGRYARAYRSYYEPVMSKHEYMLEQFVVHYAFKTMFPFGSDVVNRGLTLGPAQSLFSANYMLLGSYYGVAKAMAIGLAARHQSAFGVDHVVRCIQSCSKTLEHCSSYPQKALDFLLGRGIRNAAGMSLLTQDPASIV